MSSILLLAPSAYRLSGVSTWLDYIVPGLEARGWRVTVGLTQGRFHNASEYLASHPLPRTVRIENPTGSFEGRVRAIHRTIDDVDPDLVVVVELPDAFEALERIRSRRSLPRVVMALHNIVPGFFDDMREYASTVDSVIGTNHLACALARLVGMMEARRIQYAPYGVVIPPRADSSGQARRLRVVYVGRLERRQKRVEDVPLIFEEANRRGLGLDLVIVGRGSEEAWLRTMLARRGSPGNVHFAGNIPPVRMLPDVYREADVLLLTSHWETGPLVVWEACAAQLAVVTSSYIGSGLEGSLHHGENCLMFSVGDAKGATDRLEEAQDATRRQLIASAGRALVASRYSRETSVDRWDGCLRNVLEWPPPLMMRTTRERASTGGRLDRLVGVRLAETVRSVLRRKFAHTSASEEWPYVNGGRSVDDENFWKMAEALDRAGIEEK